MSTEQPALGNSDSAETVEPAAPDAPEEAKPEKGKSASVPVGRIVGVMLLFVAVYGAYAVYRGVGKMGHSLASFGWWPSAPRARSPSATTCSASSSGSTT